MKENEFNWQVVTIVAQNLRTCSLLTKKEYQQKRLVAICSKHYWWWLIVVEYQPVCLQWCRDMASVMKRKKLDILFSDKENYENFAQSSHQTELSLKTLASAQARHFIISVLTTGVNGRGSI